MKGQRKQNNHQEKLGIKEMNYFQIFQRNLVTLKLNGRTAKDIEARLKKG